MPNHVRNKLTFRGSKEFVEQLVNAVRTHELAKQKQKSSFDFNQIIPMPKSLDIVSGTATDNGMQYLLLTSNGHTIGFTDHDFQLVERMDALRDSEDKKDRDEFARCIKLGRAALKNIANYGAPTWYEWCNAHWGTKWNAYDIEDSDLPNSITFSTAWNFPYLVIKRLSEMFPEVKIDFIFADEDCGSNTGRGTFVAGEEKNFVYPPEGSKEAYELYIAAWGEKDWLVYDKETDNYRYVEDV